MAGDIERAKEGSPAGQRHLERLVMLSDGIFAIAITLSAIEIKPESGDGVSLWEAWKTPLFVYFLSFFLIGLVWLVHRRIVSHLRDVDMPGTVINMCLLSLVALVPMVVRFALTNPSRHEAFLVYSLAFAVLYVGMAVLWAYVAFFAKLVHDISTAEARKFLFELCFVVVVFAAAVLWQSGLVVAAVVCVVLALPLRWMAWR